MSFVESTSVSRRAEMVEYVDRKAVCSSKGRFSKTNEVSIHVFDRGKDPKKI